MKTPDEIKKGLEQCVNDAYGCNGKCPYFNSLSNGVDCAGKLHADALAYIQQLEERNSKLEYTLLGVMHSVDKWLDVEPYDFDKDDGTVAATRASNAREIALKAIENAQADLAQVERERDAALSEWKRTKLDSEGMCWTCKHGLITRIGSCRCVSPDPCDEGENWEWRGVCEENAKER